MNASLAAVQQAALNPPQLARSVLKNPRLLSQVLAGLGAQPARIKFGCDKVLRLVSESRPELLYPHFDFFVRQLDHPNNILRWGAIRVLAQLARVDAEDKIGVMLNRYLAPIRGPVMITAANVIHGGALIARAKPYLADRIAGRLLQVSRARYQTPECRNVAIGHALLALNDIFDLLKTRAPILRFARQQISNARPATRKKAEKFLQQLPQNPRPNSTKSRSRGVHLYG